MNEQPPAVLRARIFSAKSRAVKMRDASAEKASQLQSSAAALFDQLSGEYDPAEWCREAQAFVASLDRWCEQCSAERKALDVEVVELALATGGSGLEIAQLLADLEKTIREQVKAVHKALAATIAAIAPPLDPSDSTADPKA